MHRSPLKGTRHWASERPADPIGILCVFGRGLAGMEGAVRVDRLDEPCGRRSRLAEALATGPVPTGVRNGLAAGGRRIRTLGPSWEPSRLCADLSRVGSALASSLSLQEDYN